MDLKYSAKCVLRKTALSLCLFTAGIAYAHAHSKTYTMPEWVSNLVPYAGADAQIKHIDWVKDYGGNLYKRDHLQGNVFGGVGLTPHLNLELGYELTPVRENSTRLSGGTVLGNRIGVGVLQSQPLVFKSKFQIKGWHIDLMSHFPIYEDHKLDLVVGLGFSKSKIFQFTELFANMITVQRPDVYSRTFVAKKSILRVTGGFQRMISESYGIRFLVNWMNTSKFGMIGYQANPPSVVKVRDSFSYGFGVFFKF